MLAGVLWGYEERYKMKLRNKQTGETGYLELEKGDSEKYIGLKVYLNDFMYKRYGSLDKLNEEWEDYKEPKKHYSITEFGEVFELNEPDISLAPTDIRNLNTIANVEDYKEIGNYFETKEEGEKAVEQLKAWKRLKDKGFQFCGICTNLREIYFAVPDSFFSKNNTSISDETRNDLTLLFGDL